MPQYPKIDFSDTKQDRSKKTLEDLLEAAYQIIETNDPAAFTSRNLAKRAGYSKGTLNNRLGAVENVFFWALARGRDFKANQTVNIIAQFDPQLTIHDFVETFVDHCFGGINSVTAKVIKYHDQKFTKAYGLTPDYFDWINIFVEPYVELCQRNQTNTFKVVSNDEARFMFKAIHAVVERPFATDDPIAGTAEHRRIAIEALIRLLAK
ncbi:MAG: TetR/AcrR family transcriptional regulator [Burkholderiaceae bacterium]|jgi:AcrR family transcriptional regulator|nr:TetR/AcrR family transcriptional regulator [Burkholderiaceae bacterium]